MRLISFLKELRQKAWFPTAAYFASILLFYFFALSRLRSSSNLALLAALIACTFFILLASAFSSLGQKKYLGFLGQLVSLIVGTIALVPAVVLLSISLPIMADYSRMSSEGIDDHFEEIKKVCNHEIKKNCKVDKNNPRHLYLCLAEHDRAIDCSKTLHRYVSDAPLEEDTNIAGLDFPKGARITYYLGIPFSAELSGPFKFGNVNCNKTSLRFQEVSEKADQVVLQCCDLNGDQEFGGIKFAGAKNSFFDILSHNTATCFHPSGQISQAILAEDLNVGDRALKKGALVHFTPNGELEPY